MSKPISERPTAAMVRALRTGRARGPTRLGLVARRLACPGRGPEGLLRFTPLGRWVVDLVRENARLRAEVVALRRAATWPWPKYWK